MQSLNQMVQYSQTHFDVTFAALSDATRRGVLGALMGQDASISDLASRFHMTLTGMKKHVGVLEQAGLVATAKVGRVRVCRLGPSHLQDEMDWMATYRQLWAARFAGLEDVVAELKQQERTDGRPQDTDRPEIPDNDGPHL